MQVLPCPWLPLTTPSDPGGVLFWAETTEGDRPHPRRGRPPTSDRPRPHPFCAPALQTRRLLATLDHEPPAAQTQEIVLLLPTGRAGPRPSPQLLHDWEFDADEALKLAPWRISGVWLPIADAFVVLNDLPLPEETPPGLAIGADCRYWATAADLALEALAQQKIAPTLAPLDETKGTFVARWLMVLDGPQDAPRLARLARAMPPLCRAVWPQEGKFLSPRALLESFLETLGDALARRWAPPSPIASRRRQEAVAFRWLNALSGAQAKVEGSTAQLKALQRSIEAWRRNLHIAGGGDFRVSFRLAPPAQDPQEAQSPQWTLHYALQARDDPSLLVPAAEIWQTRGEVLNHVGRKVDRPQERLLAALGYTARLFPPIGRSLRAAQPSQLSLNGDEAFTFLRETAPLLEQSGFGVLVPPWWNQRGARLGLRLRIRPQQSPSDATAGRLNMQKLFAYRWELSVGDTALTAEEFQALVALKSPLVQIRGQWVQLDPEQIEAALHFWQTRREEEEITLLEALQMGLVSEPTVEGLPVEDIAFEGWAQEWLHKLTARERLEELPPPAGLRGQLRPYQRYGFSWIEFLRRWGIGAILADDMGLGKSIQTIALLLKDKEQGGTTQPVLLICPTSVVGNWRREIERFAPDLSVWIHQGNLRLQGDAFAAEAVRHDLVITSYALARRDAELLQGVSWRGVILDEAQNIKNPGAKQTQVIRDLPAGFRLALTGTPVENRLSELWSIMHFLNPGYLGSQEHFRQHFARPIERHGDEEAAQRLRSLVGPFILRRVKTDPRVIQDLPEKLEMKVYCNLSEEQATLYEAVVQESLSQLDEAEGLARRGQILAMLMKLKQVCNHPVLFLHQAGGRSAPGDELAGRSGKLDRLREMLEEAIAAGDRALVFTQFAEMGQILHGYLQQAFGCPVLFLHGDTPAVQRDRMVARFQSEDGPPIFILSLKAGGTGLNLTQANHVFHFDRWWNPAVEDQATDRAFRIGQTRNVQVHKFISSGTLEEMIDDLIESKRSLAQAIVGSGESWLTELSTDELRQLVALRRDQIT